MNNNLIQASSRSLQKYFEDGKLFDNSDALKEWLVSHIIRMLMNDMEGLLGILYRMDVSEKKFREAFMQNQPELIAPRIAELMLERELQKAETRLKYRE